MSKPAFALRQIDGVLLLDKPLGITSNAALQCVKRLLRAAKAGHVGTLDPLATGLLPVCFGEATKFSSDAAGADKSYEAEILLGVTTTTADAEGEVTSRQAVDVCREQIAGVLRQFVGMIEQTPPMYSALKRAGKPLYAYARAGQSLVIEPRVITIHEIDMLDFSADRLNVNVCCSKGTYIRVLAEDIGRALGCGAMLAGLRRTAVGGFRLAQAVKLDQMEALPEEKRLECLLPSDLLVSALPKLLLTGDMARRMMLGQAILVEPPAVSGAVRLYDQDSHFLGMGELQLGGRLIPLRLVAPGRPSQDPRIA